MRYASDIREIHVLYGENLHLSPLTVASVAVGALLLPLGIGLLIGRVFPAAKRWVPAIQQASGRLFLLCLLGFTMREQVREVQDADGCWFSLRVRPYVSTDKKVDGAVLVLVDIDALKRAELTTTVAREYADNNIDERFQADVAVVDIGLPVMDVYELAGQIRSGRRVPRLIAMTGYGQPADRVRSRQAGFDDHLVKPVDVAALIAVIHRAEPPQTSSDSNGDADRK